LHGGKAESTVLRRKNCGHVVGPIYRTPGPIEEAETPKAVNVFYLMKLIGYFSIRLNSNALTLCKHMRVAQYVQFCVVFYQGRERSLCRSIVNEC